MVGHPCDGHRFGGSSSRNNARFCPDMLVVVLEEVPHVSDIVVRFENTVPV